MASTPGNEDRHGLHTGLKRRHVTMIALGGVIGAGLFVGSGAVINQTGPAAVLSYLMAGVLVVLVMRMLGEMAVANPARARSRTARLSLGNWAGFSVGWLYWWFWVIVLAVEAVAGSRDPAALDRRADLGLEPRADDPADAHEPRLREGVRRVRVLVRLDQGCRDRRVHLPRAGYVFGLTGGEGGVSQLTAEGGFAPEGFGMVLTGVVIVIFAFVGAEIATIAAAESDEPRRAVTKATNS
jgi:GABA permease